MTPIFFNWSSGKDSAMALYKLLSGSDYRVDTLLTTINSDLGRVSMHGLREALLDQQVASIGLPIRKVGLPESVSMTEYTEIMEESSKNQVRQGIMHAGFGDIFLEDLRAYRESALQKIAVKAVFPLWKRDTRELMEEFFTLGFKAVTVSVNAELLGKDFVGREVDRAFIDALPPGVDPCGENGEFHTFVYDGPIFKYPIPFKVGEKVLKGYTPNEENDDCFSDDVSWDTKFWYCDLLTT